jgi:hypothetical protein
MAQHDFFHPLKDRGRGEADRAADVDLSAAGCRRHIYLDPAVDAPRVDCDRGGDIGRPGPKVVVKNGACRCDPPLDLRRRGHLDCDQGFQFLKDHSHFL